MNDHHLILGTLTDFLTGNVIPDTLDERYRQAIARILVLDCQIARHEIAQDVRLTAVASDKKAILKIDFVIQIDGKYLMLIKYGPGSITTRHRPALAASRLISPHQIPRVVVTNGENADILDGKTGDLLGQGLNAIPSRDDLIALRTATSLEPISPKRAALESRILYAFDVDGSCPCDTDICRIQP